MELRDNRLAVVVTGTAKGRPNLMRVRLVAEATAGSATDALQQCKTKADAAVRAVEDLNLDGVRVVRETFTFSSPMSGNPYMAAQGGAVQPAGTRVSQEIQVNIPIADPVNSDGLAQSAAKVIDIASRSGVGFMQPAQWQVQTGRADSVSTIEYVLEDGKELRKAAMADVVTKLGEAKENLKKAGLPVGEMTGMMCSDGSLASLQAYWAMFTNEAEKRTEESVRSNDPTKVEFSLSVTVLFYMGK
jgi:uncharacterized protein YggE